jgi:predicted nucleotidyltransferase
MLPSTLLQTRKHEIRTILARYPMLSNIKVCGSVARGEDAEGSDIDFLVEPGPGTTLFDLGGLREDLEDLLGVPVDIVSTNSRMNAAMKQAMLREAVSI